MRNPSIVLSNFRKKKYAPGGILNINPLIDPKTGLPLTTPAAGGFNPANMNFGAIGNTLGNLGDAALVDKNGNKTNSEAALTGVVRGAGTGASIGSALGPIGTAVGAGIGAIAGGITSAKRNKKQLGEYYKNKSLEEMENSKIANQEYDATMLNYDRGTEPVSYFAKGGIAPIQALDKSSKTLKINGKRHEQGGVTIGNSEVERGEVIHGNKVFSNRLRVPGTNRTYAGEAQRLIGRPKFKTLEAKLEKGDMLKVDDYRAGSLARNVSSTLAPLNSLFNRQELGKVPTSDKRKFATGGIFDPYAIKLAQEAAGQYRNYNEGPVGPEVPMPANPYSFAQDAAKNPIEAVGPNNFLTTPPVKGWKQDNLAVAGLQRASDVIGKIKAKNPNALEPYLRASAAPIEPVPAQLRDETDGAQNRDPLFTGKNVMSAFEKTAPYIDNITNAILTAKSPKIPVPKYASSAKLKTTYNINPQLAEIEKGNMATKRTLIDNTTGGSELRGSLLANSINNIGAKSNLLGQKENAETDLKNKQATMDADTANRNRSTQNQYNMNKFGRLTDIQTRISQNAANLTEDVQQQIIDKKLNQSDQVQLALVLKKYKGTGVLDRMGTSRMIELIKSGKSAEEAIKILDEEAASAKKK